MNVVILHGTLGNPKHNWYPWLGTELESRGHRVIRPQLPTPEGQILENWVKTISDSVEFLDTKFSELIFVAHSMSPLAVCHYLSTIKHPVAACFFVAPFAERLSNTPDPYPELNNPFVDREISWDRVIDKSRKFVCFASDDDPYVPFETTKNMAEKLNARLVPVPLAGHFNRESGYTEFPLLLKEIDNLLSNHG